MYEEAEQVHKAHRDYYLRLAERASKSLLTREHEAWLAQLAADDGNLRAALEWSKDQPDSGDTLTRLSTALTTYWEFTGRMSEGRKWSEEALARSSASEERVRSLVAASRLVMAVEDFETAGAMLDESMALALANDDAYGEAETYSHRGYLALTRHDLPASIEAHTSGLARWRALGLDDHVADSLTCLGMNTLLLGDVPRAIAYLEESLALCRRSSTRFYLADALLALGFARFLSGDPAAGVHLLAEGMQVAQALSAVQLVARALEEFAFVAGMTGDAGRAAQLLGAAQAYRERINVPMPRAYHDLYQQLLGTLQAQMGAAALDEAIAHGRTLTIEQAMTLALAFGGASDQA